MLSRTQKFARGIGFGYTGQVLTTVVGLWLTPFLLVRVGQHDYGLWLVGTQLMFYVGLLDVGVMALLPRETAFATGRAGSVAEARDLPVIIGQTSRLVFWQTPIVAIAAAIVWFSLPVEWAGLREPIAVVLGVFVITFPLRIFSAVLQGLQDFGFLAKANIGAFIISTAVTVVCVLGGLGLYALAFGWLVLHSSLIFANLLRLRTHFPGVLPRTLPRLGRENLITHLKRGFWVTAYQVAQVLICGTDILIIGKLFGPLAVVPYVCTAKLITVLTHQPQILLQVAAPALSELRTGAQRTRLSEVCTALGQAMLMASGLVVCLALLVNAGFVERWVGAHQYGGFWLTAIILMNMLLRHWNLTAGIALFSFGYDRRLCLTALADSLICAVAMTLFIWRFGLIGAPLGLMTGVCLISLPANLSALARECHKSIWQLVAPLGPWFVRFIAFASLAAVLGNVWAINTIPLLAAAAVGTVLIYGLVMFPVALRYPLGAYVQPRIFPIATRLSRMLRLEQFFLRRQMRRVGEKT